MAVITISRKYGSGGNEIARRVCKILGYRYFDKNLMAQIAMKVGLSEHELVDYSEDNYKVRGFLERLLDTKRVVTEVKSWTRDASGAQTVTVEELNEERCIELVRSAVRAAHTHGNVVILGRGGQAILKELPGVLHVRIESPLGACVMRVQSKENLSLGAAETLTRERDQAAAAYLNRFYGINWADPLNYHLTLNSCKWDIEAAVQIIVSAVSHLRGGDL